DEREEGERGDRLLGGGREVVALGVVAHVLGGEGVGAEARVVPEEAVDEVLEEGPATDPEQRGDGDLHLIPSMRWWRAPSRGRRNLGASSRPVCARGRRARARAAGVRPACGGAGGRGARWRGGARAH